MADNPNGTLLKITRVLIYVMLVFILIAGLALATASVVMPFFWTEVVAGIAEEKPGINAEGLMPELYVLFAFAIVALGAASTILQKLLAIIDTVAQGDPFVRANAVRLKAIGWIMVGIQLLGVPLALVATRIGHQLHEADMSGDFSIVGVLSTLLVFVLAGVFERGAAMREELEGTV
jgi:Protein of unknown function (DUF2975)